nr:carboxymuconolactone decarboxylase family protein [Kineosporia babensis]
MKQRMSNPAALLPETYQGVGHLMAAIHSGGVPEQTLELVHLRASQINGCTACIHTGVQNAAKVGLSTERMLALPGWAESPLFDDAERAALALAEAMTRLADNPGSVSEEIWDAVADHFDEKQLAAIILHVATANFFNRLNTTVRQAPVDSWS